MAIGIAKRVVVEILRRSKDERLRALGNLVNDAEGAAVTWIIGRIEAALRRGGGEIDGKEVEGLLAEGRKIKPGSSKADPLVATTEDGFLEIYLDTLRSIRDIGSSHPALLLRGFIHDGNCVSLWIFAPGTHAELTIEKSHDGRKIISVLDKGIDIRLLAPLAEAELIALNEELGRSGALPMAELERRFDLAEADQLRWVTADAITVEASEKIERQRPGGRTSVRYKHSTEERPTDKTFAGIEAMLASLPLALEARGKALAEAKAKARPA